MQPIYKFNPLFEHYALPPNSFTDYLFKYEKVKKFTLPSLTPNSQPVFSAPIKPARPPHGLLLLKNIPQKELYRLIVDGKFHAPESGWRGYAWRQKGCLPAAYKALSFAFTGLSKEEVSIAYIKNIHKHCMEFKSYTRAGQFRPHSVAFALIKSNTTKKGFFSLYDKVRRESEQYNACISVAPQNYFDHMTSDEDCASRTAALDFSAQSPEELWQMLQKDDETAASQSVYYRAPCAEAVEEILTQACSTYNQAITTAQNETEKLRIIATLVQAIDQTHPFSDGNIRVSLIILQRLLVQHGFPPVMLYDPNCIDAYDLDALIEEIKKGMACTYQLVNDPDFPLYHFHTQSYFYIPPPPLEEREKYFKSGHLIMSDIIYDDAYTAEKSLYDVIQFESDFMFHLIQLIKVTELRKQNHAEYALMLYARSLASAIEQAYYAVQPQRLSIEEQQNFTRLMSLTYHGLKNISMFDVNEYVQLVNDMAAQRSAVKMVAGAAAFFLVTCLVLITSITLGALFLFRVNQVVTKTCDALRQIDQAWTEYKNQCRTGVSLAAYHFLTQARNDQEGLVITRVDTHRMRASG